MQQPTAAAALLKLFPGATRARIIATGFAVSSDESASLRCVGTALTQEMAMHAHYAGGGPDQQPVAALIVDWFFVGTHFWVRVVLMRQRPNRDHVAGMLIIIE